MTDAKRLPHGSFCWADLGTKDAEAAKRFYTTVFPWRAVDMPAGPGMTYTMLFKGEKDVCALFNQRPGMPSFWQTYFAVDSADEFAKKAESVGGKIVQPPMDVFDVGRMVAVADPTGAVFVGWQGKSHPSAGVMHEPDTLTWCEADTTNLDQTVGFYTKLFGWKTKIDGDGAHKYVHFQNGDAMVGGAMQIQKEWGPGIPSHWAICFAVSDVDATAARATGAGGKTLMGPTTLPGTGRFAVIADPQGATFQIFKSERH
jgi:predicted enzyme related to lactoylglutathione lyase